MTSSETNKETIIVTGGTGLVGNGIRSALDSPECSKYKAYNWVFLSSKDLDLLNREQTCEFVKSHKPKFIIHLAARVGGLFANMNDNHGFLFDNLLMNVNVLEAAHKAGVKRLLCCLSTCIFPDQITYPIDETKLHLGPPHDSNYGYSYAKRMLEVMCRSYNEQFKTQFIPFIPTNVYGAHDNFKLSECHVIPALMHKALIAKSENKPLLVAGSGKPLRQFIYSVDLGRLILWTLFEYSEVTPIILSVPEEDEMSIAQAAEAVAKSMGLEQGIKITNEGPDGQFKKTAGTKKLQQHLPDFKFTPFTKAIDDTCKWFVENFESARK